MRGETPQELINSGLGESNVVDVAGANDADGQWHHVQAVCDSMSGSDGQLRFTVVNAAGRTIDTPLSRMRLCMASI